MPRPLSSRLKSIQVIPLSGFFLCALAAMLVIALGDPHNAPFPGYHPVHLRRVWQTLYVKPWAQAWSDRLFMTSIVFLLLFGAFIPFIRYNERRERE